MKEQYVTYEVAKLLREKGFRGDCIAYYNEDGKKCLSLSAELHPLPCPTQAVACRWLRETYDIMFTTDRKKIVEDETDPFYDYYCIISKNSKSYYISSSYYTQRYREYEEVIEDALKYCLENLV